MIIKRRGASSIDVWRSYSMDNDVHTRIYSGPRDSQQWWQLLNKLRRDCTVCDMQFRVYNVQNFIQELLCRQYLR